MHIDVSKDPELSNLIVCSCCGEVVDPKLVKDETLQAAHYCKHVSAAWKDNVKHYALEPKFVTLPKFYLLLKDDSNVFIKPWSILYAIFGESLAILYFWFLFN